jgi:hypothetical protein
VTNSSYVVDFSDSSNFFIDTYVDDAVLYLRLVGSQVFARRIAECFARTQVKGRAVSRTPYGSFTYATFGE